MTIRRPLTSLRLSLGLTLTLTLLASATAQRLADALPDDTLFALGMYDLEGFEDRLEPFIAEFNRLDVAAAFEALGEEDLMGPETGGAAMPGMSPETGGAMGPETGGAAMPEMGPETGAAATPEMMAEVEGLLERFDLEPRDVFGQEAWIVVSASAFNPLPAVTLATRLSDAGVEAFQEALAEVSTEEGVRELSEGDFTFYELPLEDPDAPVQVIAYALADDTLLLSSNPDTLRGVLRRLAGSDEPSLSSTEGYTATLGQLGEGNFVSYLDYARIVEVARPFAQGLGIDELVDRLDRALTTAGVAAGVVRVTDTGLESRGFQAINQEGGDPQLYALLTGDGSADREAAALAPAEALSVVSSATDLRGWWDYLNSFARDIPQLGSDLDTLILSFTGVNLRQTLFSWIEPQVTTITTGFGEAAQPGVPSDNLLGEQVFALATNDEAAAENGLDTLFQSLSQTLAAFSDPSGEGEADISTQEVDGVTVTTFAISDGLALSYAVRDGLAFVATSADGLARVLSTTSETSLAADDAYQTLSATIPEGVSSFSFSDDRASFESIANQISSSIQLGVGLSGSGGIDFDAVEEASETIEAYLNFIAERLGNTVAYSERGEDGVSSRSETEVNWDE